MTAAISVQDVVSVKGVSVFYTRRSGELVQAVDNVSFTVGDQEFVSLLGPSGCGKTSLLRCIAGLRSVSQGEIALSYDKGQAPFGLVFQSSSLLPWMTVLKNVAYGAESLPHSKGSALEKARQALDLVGLGHVADRHPRELSGGMQQRVNVARALTVDPALLLMDEPLAALDAQLRERMQWEFSQIIERFKRSALLVTHQVDEAVYLSDRVLVMSASPGRIKAEIVIDLPRPRPLSIKRSPEFAHMVDTIWAELEES